MPGFRIISIVVASFLCLNLSAQFENIVFNDHIYVPNVKTVQLHLAGLPNSLPFYEIGKPASLHLSFDDLDGVPKYYTYRIIHCDMNWNPSDLMYHEYATGFENEEIFDFAYSVTTRIQYAHYQVRIPNRNTELTKSGNYLIVVHEEGDMQRPVLSRRFVVVEPPVITMRLIRTRPANVSKMNTHQEIRFDIDTKQLLIRDPKSDIVCTVLQNGRWDNAITGLTSRFEKGTLLTFDYLDKVSFAAGKEFRSIDLRSTQYRGEGIFELEKVDNYMRLIGKLDRPRVTEPFFSKVDLNGKFVISTTDYPDSPDPELRSDYVETIFTLETGRKYDEDIYVFGGLTDFELRDEFRMTYDPNYQSYSTAAWLKQGFYDYIYVIGNADGSADETTLEGHWFESTNDYSLLVYYRPFGARYDRVVGVTTFEWGR